MSVEITDLTYEAAREELVQVVARLERGDANLDDMITLWERGEALATYCQDLLDAARGKLEAASGSGTITT